MTSQNVSSSVINLVKKFEGLHKVQEDGTVSAYRCPAGKWTIGYGHTKGVKSGAKATQQECEDFLKEDLEEVGNVVRRYVKVPLTQTQYDALVSFIFNLGGENFRKSTLLKKLNVGKYEEVPSEILKWNKARVDGELRALPGLTRRRTAEAALFSMDAPLSADGGDLMPQRPVQEALKPLSKSKTMAGASLAGAGTILSETASQLEGLVGYSGVAETLFLLVAVAGIGLVAYSRFNDHKEGVH
jgi:lysozyme